MCERCPTHDRKKNVISNEPPERRSVVFVVHPSQSMMVSAYMKKQSSSLEAFYTFWSSIPNPGLPAVKGALVAVGLHGVGVDFCHLA